MYSCIPRTHHWCSWTSIYKWIYNYHHRGSMGSERGCMSSLSERAHGLCGPRGKTVHMMTALAESRFMGCIPSCSSRERTKETSLACFSGTLTPSLHFSGSMMMGAALSATSPLAARLKYTSSSTGQPRKLSHRTTHSSETPTCLPSGLSAGNKPPGST